MNKIILTFALSAILSSQLVVAGGINHRQQNQARRIGQGIHSGQLTARETKQLIKQQRSIARMERHFKSDGHFTKIERARVQRQLNHSSAQIYKQKHDRQQR